MVPPERGYFPEVSETQVCAMNREQVGVYAGVGLHVCEREEEVEWRGDV